MILRSQYLDLSDQDRQFSGSGMGNFCMGDVGRNGIADRKHEKPSKGRHFRPRSRVSSINWCLLAGIWLRVSKIIWQSGIIFYYYLF